MSALLLAGCGTPLPVRESLPLAARDQIASTETVVPIRQHEIYVFVPPSTAGATAGAGFGIVGALVGVAIDASVDSARTSKAEAAVKPLRDALVDYNFDATFQDDLKASLPPVEFMHSDEIRVVKEVANDSADLALTNSKDAAVLFVTTDYHLANDGDVLYVTLQTSLYPNSTALKAIKPPKKPSDRRQRSRTRLSAEEHIDVQGQGCRLVGSKRSRPQHRHLGRVKRRRHARQSHAGGEGIGAGVGGGSSASGF